MKAKEKELLCFSFYVGIVPKTNITEVRKKLAETLGVKPSSKPENRFSVKYDRDYVVLELNLDGLTMSCYTKITNQHVKAVYLEIFLGILARLKSTCEIKLEQLLLPINEALAVINMLGKNNGDFEAKLDCIRIHALSESNSVLAIELQREWARLEKINSELSVYRRFCAEAAASGASFKAIGISEDLEKNVLHLLKGENR